MVIRLLFLLALLLPLNANAFTQLTATVDKNPAMLNESITLSIVADAKLSSSQLDISSLLRDFTVGHTSTNQSTQIINSDIKHSTQWKVVLFGRKTGKFTIPAFTIKNVSSSPINLEVIEVSQTDPRQAKEVFLESSADRTEVYLQGSITYTTKLYLALEFQRGSLTEPQMDNANVIQINDKRDEESSEIRGGVRYRVITRVYSITPQRSGDYQITPPIFNGELLIKRQGSFVFGLNKTKPVNVVGQELTIEVLPIPADYSGQWLPSTNVVLNEQWQPTQQEYTVGDPITRIITLSAMGVNEEQLPEIEVTYPDSVKTYPDQSTLHSSTRANVLVSQRKESIAIVPNKPGKLILPEVKVPWFDTNKNQVQYATLPEKTINVVASQNSAQPALVTPQLPSSTPNDAPQEIITEIQQVPVNSMITWIFLALWILSLLLWMLHVRAIKKSLHANTQTTTSSATSGKTYWALFEKACKNNDGATAINEFLRWGRARWPEQKFNSAMEVALFLGAKEVLGGIKELQHSLYSQTASQWQGQALLDVAAKNKNPTTSKSSEQLNPLHPA